MKYEFRAKSLAAAVSQSLAPQPVRLERKESVTVSAGLGRYSRADMSVDVIEGRRYTISWEADEPAGEGGVYGIDIISSDGHGSTREAFSSSGRWSFTARQTGMIEFTIGVSRSFGSPFGSFDVTIDID